jgi:hypothetical protein
VIAGTAITAALSFLQRMSGIATVAAPFAEAVTGLPARILDTRKTAPGLRALDKAAVAAGRVSEQPAITHSAPAFDLSLLLTPTAPAGGGHPARFG